MRKRIFEIFSGFLAIMLAFTLLSRAVNGAAMARVETVRIATGTIEHKVTGSGRVEAGKEVAVYTESGQRVKEICVQADQSVEAGDVLFRVDLEELGEQILAAQQELEKLKLQEQDARSARNLEEQNRETAKNRAAEDYNQAVAQGDQSVADAKAAWDAAQQALRDFLANESSSQQEPDSGTSDTKGSKESEAADMKENEESETEEAETEETPDNTPDFESQKSVLEQAEAEAKAAYETALSSRTENIKAAARALEDASGPVSADSTSEQNEITIQQQEQALQKLLDLQEAKGEITAPVKGVVTELSITTGDFTPEGTAARMADTSQGSRLVASVSKSSEAYVSKGSPVTITASGSKEPITDYTVSSVTANAEDSELLDVTVELPEGVLEAGTLADLEIVHKSGNYSAVLPVQALHEEQNGYYVLVLQEEQSVLGTELVAKRLEVEVLDKNGVDAAVTEGLLSGDQEIVSSSTKAIGEGSRVRKQVL